MSVHSVLRVFMIRVLTLFVALTIVLVRSTDVRVQSLHATCETSPLCRSLFQQDHGDISTSRFEILLQNIPDVDLMNVTMIDQDTLASLLADRMALYQLVYSESRCPPNRYWFWNETTATGSCRCYFDSDCRIDILSLCHSQTHPIILIAFCIVICFGVFSIISNNCKPIGKREKRSKRP